MKWFVRYVSVGLAEYDKSKDDLNTFRLEIKTLEIAIERWLGGI